MTAQPDIAAVLLRAALFMAVAIHGGAGFAEEQPLAVELDTLETAVDGSVRSGCRIQFEIHPGSTQGLWIVFGAVKPDAGSGWEPVAPRIHCGGGSFEAASSRLGRMLGVPYVVVDLETIAAPTPGPDVHLDASLAIRKLSGFDQEGQPAYVRRTERRALRALGDGDSIIPLVTSDAREREAFGVNEVFVRLRTRAPGREPALAYGSISVAADIPGAEILLDGGFVGHVPERGSTLLKNVLVGDREIRVRDFSGREARKHVVVERDQTADVALSLLNLPSPAPGNDLVSIGKNAQGFEEYWRVEDRAMMVRIPAGEFLMGSREGEGEPLERPQHRVHVSEFLIDKTEVTWRQLRAYAEATGAALPPAPLWGTREDYAACNLLWPEANAYCEWVGGRLPTEAEWEKAARGTDGRKYPWGDEWDPDRCNSFDGGPHGPGSVGTYAHCLSPYGVMDMTGSVWEWCADWFDGSYYAESASTDPKGPPSGSSHVLRGGSWLNQATWLRPAYRHKGDLTSRNVHNGFRCARDHPG